MMKRILFGIFLFSFCSSQAQNYNWQWARSSSNGGGEGTNIITDRFDNVYVTGFYDSTTISFGSVMLTGNAQETFLVKYDSNGNVKWARGSSGGRGAYGSWGCKAAADNSGNVFLTGLFYDTVSFGAFSLISSGSSDVFLVKYDSSGNVLWARSAGSTAMDEGLGLATDASGSVYLTGYYMSSVFHIGSNSFSGHDLFVAKYDSSGNLVWAKEPSSGLAYGYSVATDALANVYLTGWSNGTLTLGSHSITNSVGTQVFVAKFDSSGNTLWLVAPTSAQAGSNGYCIATDLSANVYVTGGYQFASISFGGYTLTNTSNSANENDAFLAKYDSSGNVLWAKNIAGNGNDRGFGVTVDRLGKVWMTGGCYGFTSDSLKIDTLTLHFTTLDPMFIAEYDSSGRALFATGLSSGGDDYNAVAVNSQGCVYVGGDYVSSPFIFGNDTLLFTGSHENVFVAKLCYSGLRPDFVSSDSTICAERNNCINFYDYSTGMPTSWQWHFTGAFPDTSSLQNPTNICYSSPGTYPVTLIVSNSAGSDTLTISPMIIVGGTPSLPVITILAGDTLVSSHAAQYQWLLNGIIISGATDSFYVAHQDGTYSVQITDGYGCNALSAGVEVGIDELSGGGGIEVYPNPVGDQLAVGNSKLAKGATVSVYNVLGEKVMTEDLSTKGKTGVDVRDLVAGVYFLTVTSEWGRFVGKFMKR